MRFCATCASAQRALLRSADGPGRDRGLQQIVFSDHNLAADVESVMPLLHVLAVRVTTDELSLTPMKLGLPLALSGSTPYPVQMSDGKPNAMRSNRDDGRERRYGEDIVRVRALKSHLFAYHEYGFTFGRPWCSTGLS